MKRTPAMLIVTTLSLSFATEAFAVAAPDTSSTQVTINTSKMKRSEANIAAKVQECANKWVSGYSEAQRAQLNRYVKNIDVRSRPGFFGKLTSFTWQPRAGMEGGPVDRVGSVFGMRRVFYIQVQEGDGNGSARQISASDVTDPSFCSSHPMMVYAKQQLDKYAKGKGAASTQAREELGQAVDDTHQAGPEAPGGARVAGGGDLFNDRPKTQRTGATRPSANAGDAPGTTTAGGLGNGTTNANGNGTTTSNTGNGDPNAQGAPGASSTAATVAATPQTAEQRFNADRQAQMDSIANDLLNNYHVKVKRDSNGLWVPEGTTNADPNAIALIAKLNQLESRVYVAAAAASAPGSTTTVATPPAPPTAPVNPVPTTANLPVAPPTVGQQNGPASPEQVQNFWDRRITNMDGNIASGKTVVEQQEIRLAAAKKAYADAQASLGSLAPTNLTAQTQLDSARKAVDAEQTKLDQYKQYHANMQAFQRLDMNGYSNLDAVMGNLSRLTLNPTVVPVVVPIP